MLKLAAEHASGMMSAAQLEALGRMLLDVYWRSGMIAVEIGTYHGGTSAFMAKVLRLAGHPEIPVVAIDPFERSGPADQYNARGAYDAYIRTITEQGVTDQCFAIATWSQQAVSVIPDTIGVLVVDGNHVFEECEAELRLYVPKVVKGGWVFVDDDCPEYYPGVVRAITEFAEVHPEIDVQRCPSHAWFQIP